MQRQPQFLRQSQQMISKGWTLVLFWCILTGPIQHFLPFQATYVKATASSVSNQRHIRNCMIVLLLCWWRPVTTTNNNNVILADFLNFSSAVLQEVVMKESEIGPLLICIIRVMNQTKVIQIASAYRAGSNVGVDLSMTEVPCKYPSLFCLPWRSTSRIADLVLDK